jgi:hypothetical protein
MEIKTLYKLVSGESVEIEHGLNVLARDGWRPVTMSSQSSLLTVILENKIMEEAKHDLSSALAEDAERESPLEEIQ